MPCDHKGPHELIEMAEQHLGLTPRDAWPGLRFRWAENLEGGMWAAVITEIERRGDEWIVTRLDRRAEKLQDNETGFRQLT